MPFAEFKETACILDYRRLGKQRVEAKQIIQTIQIGDSAKGWKNHPAVHMWRDYVPALALYGICICTEWRNRGYNDSLLPFFLEWFESGDLEMPWWLNNTDFHKSHQSNLLRKDPEYYSKFFNIDPMLPYRWPGKTDTWS